MGKSAHASRMLPRLALGRRSLAADRRDLRSDSRSRPRHAPFGCERGGTGAAQQRLGFVAVAGVHRDADMRRHAYRGTEDAERFAQRARQLQRNTLRVGRRFDLGQQQGELVTAERGDHVARAHRRAQPHGDLAAHHLGALDAMLRGDRIEPVDAQHQQRHRRRLPRTQGQQLVQVLEQLRAVRQAGVEIGAPRLARFTLEPLAQEREADEPLDGWRTCLLDAEHVLDAGSNEPVGQRVVAGRQDQQHRDVAQHRLPGRSAQQPLGIVMRNSGDDHVRRPSWPALPARHRSFRSVRRSAQAAAPAAMTQRRRRARAWAAKSLGVWSGRRESNPRMKLGKLPFCH